MKKLILCILVLSIVIINIFNVSANELNTFSETEFGGCPEFV